MRHRGIEFLNNDTTAMEAVVLLLRFVFGMSSADAFEAMLRVHRNGEALVAAVPEAHLQEVLDRLEAALAGLDHPIMYRVLDLPPEKAVFEVDVHDLPTRQDWEETLLREKRQTRTAGVLFACAVCVVALLALGLI